MLKKSDPKFTIDALVERMRAGGRRNPAAFRSTRDSPDGALGSAPRNHLSPPEVPSIELQPSFRLHTTDDYHVNDLLQYHDRAFLQNAYRAILKRNPDPTGFNDFTEALRSGRLNKIDVLARLRYSAEGRGKAVRVDGLFPRASLRLLYRVPLLGYLFHVVVGVARLPNSIRSDQKFQVHALAQQQIIADHSNHLARAIAALREEFQASFQKLLLLQHEQINEARDQISRRFAETREQLEEAIKTRESETGARLTQLNAGLENALAEEQTTRESNLENLSLALQQEQAAREKTLADLSLALQSEREARQETFQTLSLRLDEENTRLQSEAVSIERRLSSATDSLLSETEQLAGDLQAEMLKLFQKQQEVRAELVLQGERVARLLDEAGDRGASKAGKQRPDAYIEEAAHSLDAFYLALEDQFRGSRTEIRQRLQIYLPIIEEAGIGRKETRLLDLGCGRGEWLELLKETGYHAVGVDSNRLLIKHCREHDLEVVEDDIVNHLRTLPDASVDAVTGFHIVEHLPFETLVRFLDETVRVVKSGGLVIFETPNPENVLVGTCNFYFDPMHRNPLPGPVMKFLLESRGFTRVRTIDLNPSDETPVAGTTDLTLRFNRYFYGPMDYAVVGVRPQAITPS